MSCGCRISMPYAARRCVCTLSSYAFPIIAEWSCRYTPINFISREYVEGTLVLLHLELTLSLEQNRIASSHCRSLSKA